MGSTDGAVRFAHVLLCTLAVACAAITSKPEPIEPEDAAPPDAAEDAGLPDALQDAGPPDAAEDTSPPDAAEDTGLHDASEDAGPLDATDDAWPHDATTDSPLPDASEDAPSPDAACTPAAEICNGVDDDCNPETPDGKAEPWFGSACDGADVDLCAEGLLTCADGSRACTDPGLETPDVCDGVDNDCDPRTADGAAEPALGESCDGDDDDRCQMGTTQCTGGALACVGDATYVGCDEACFDGAGTPADPHVVESPEQVDRMRWCLGRDFVLGADVDLGGTCPLAARDETAEAFSGTFGGRGRAIRNMRCELTRAFVGFFPRIDAGASVTDVRFEDAVVSGASDAGSVTGENRGAIRRVSVEGAVTVLAANAGNAGGVAGSSLGVIEDSHADVVVLGRPEGLSRALGGIVGSSIGGAVHRCSARGAVGAGWYVGGLAGASTGLIAESLSHAAVGTSTARGNAIGGLVGALGSTDGPGGEIRDCYADGPVTGSFGVGGLVGAVAGSEDPTRRITNVWVVAVVRGSMSVGAIIGARGTESMVESAYFADTMVLPAAGGGESTGMTALSAPAMRVPESYAGFDFTTPIWTIRRNLDLARLAWE